MAKNPQLITIEMGNKQVMLGEFIDALVDELVSLNVKSRLLSTKGTVDKAEVRSAIDRVIQRVSDAL